MADGWFEATLADVAEDEIFSSGGPCPSEVVSGHPRFAVVSGENTAGKSFFAKAFRAFCPEHVRIVPIGMKQRSEPGIQRAFVYGDEDWESTGQISVKAVLGALRTCGEPDGDTLLVLDEPDVGLSESYQSAMGELIAGFTADLPERLGLIVITHSRPLVRNLMRSVPTTVRVGGGMTFAEWLENGPAPASPEDLRDLSKRSVERMRSIKGLLDARKAARAAGPKR